MDDNKRQNIINIETLKYETMRAIEQIVEESSEKRKNNTQKEINNTIINVFKEILKQKEIKLDEEYAYGQLNVLASEIEKDNKILDDNLLTQINRLLNRHIEYAVEYSEEETNLKLQRNELRVDDELEEDESQRCKKINNNQIPKIEEFLHDIFSHEMRRIEHRGIKLTEANREELRYEILNRLKHRNSERIANFFKNQNNDLTINIKMKISEFFEEVNQELLQQEENEHDKKSWELTEEEMENIDPRKAVENLKENNKNKDRTPDKLGPIIE